MTSDILIMTSDIVMVTVLILTVIDFFYAPLRIINMAEMSN